MIENINISKMADSGWSRYQRWNVFTNNSIFTEHLRHFSSKADSAYYSSKSTSSCIRTIGPYTSRQVRSNSNGTKFSQFWVIKIQNFKPLSVRSDGSSTGTSVRPPLPPSKCPYVHVYITSRGPDNFLFMLRAIPTQRDFLLGLI